MASEKQIERNAFVRGQRGDRRPVTFITPDSELVIQLTQNTSDAICDAAKTLKARYFVCVDGWSELIGQPVWGVFDMRRADPNGGGPGRWSMPEAIRTFATEEPDGAVMYALTLPRS